MQITTLFIVSEKLINENGAATIGAISVLVRLGMDNGDLQDAGLVRFIQLTGSTDIFSRQTDR